MVEIVHLKNSYILCSQQLERSKITIMLCSQESLRTFTSNDNLAMNLQRLLNKNESIMIINNVQTYIESRWPFFVFSPGGH